MCQYGGWLEDYQADVGWSAVTQAYCNAASSHLREDEGRGRKAGVNLRIDVRWGDTEDDWAFTVPLRSLTGKVSKRVSDCEKDSRVSGRGLMSS